VRSHRNAPPGYRKAAVEAGWIVFYINAVTKNSSAVLSPPLTIFTFFSAATFTSRDRLAAKRRVRQRLGVSLRFYPRGSSGSRVGTTECDTNPAKDQEDTVQRVVAAWRTQV
jgi:hypothetical protein